MLAGGVAVAALVAALLISPVRTAAFGLFDVFRVEKFALITVDASKMPIKMQHDGEAAHKGGKPDPDAFGTYSGPLKPQKPREVVSLDAASGVVGYDAASAGESLGGKERSTVYVSEAVKASYTFDVAKIRAKIQEAGVRGVKAPEQLDGKTFTFNGGRGVVVLYGAQEDGVVFAQGPSPTLTIPEGVDMDYLRQDFLMIPGLPADLVAQVKEIEDWERTLIIPVPANGSSEEVKVDGAEGVLISDAKGEKNAVLWQRDGRLYAIGGEITAADALEAARRVEYR